MEIEVKIEGLLLDPITNLPIVFLKEIGGNRNIVMWIGLYEATAIALAMKKAQTPRPMTHDLLKNIVAGLNATAKKVVVTELRENTYYALIYLEKDSGVITIDSRPSDAFTLALRVDCPIYINEEVFTAHEQYLRNLQENADPKQLEQLKRWLKNLGEDDLGKYKM